MAEAQNAGVAPDQIQGNRQQREAQIPPQQIHRVIGYMKGGVRWNAHVQHGDHHNQQGHRAQQDLAAEIAMQQPPVRRLRDQ